MTDLVSVSSDASPAPAEASPTLQNHCQSDVRSFPLLYSCSNEVSYQLMWMFIEVATVFSTVYYIKLVVCLSTNGERA